jgi:hypothetical protein
MPPGNDPLQIGVICWQGGTIRAPCLKRICIAALLAIDANTGGTSSSVQIASGFESRAYSRRKRHQVFPTGLVRESLQKLTGVVCGVIAIRPATCVTSKRSAVFQFPSQIILRQNLSLASGLSDATLPYAKSLRDKDFAFFHSRLKSSNFVSLLSVY